MKKKRWDDRLTVNDNVRLRLPGMARKYLKRGAHALRPDSGWEELHEFRLATKRFRYTLEIFAPLYGPGFSTRLEHVKKVQTLLGEANDYITARSMLNKSDANQAAADRLTEKAERRIGQLRAWWQANFDSPAGEERWVQYFARLRPRQSIERR
jgi:CHAD domain-containing protein